MNPGASVSDARALNDHEGAGGRTAAEHRYPIASAVAVDVTNQRGWRKGTARVDVRAAA